MELCFEIRAVDYAGDVISGSGEHAGLLEEWFGEQWWTARAAALLVTLVVILLPLVLLRRVGEFFSVYLFRYLRFWSDLPELGSFGILLQIILGTVRI